MKRLGIYERDLVERFIRSEGKGGQNVNKTSTCVYLKHLPTGIVVKCQRERSQASNRLLARSILTEKIGKLILKRELEEKGRIERLRRLKRKKPVRIRERILENKRRHSQKKTLRSRISCDE